jgi:hypothetical protein
MPLDFPNPSVSTTYTDSTSGNTYTFANGSWSLTSILSATKGGTGFASYNRGDILFGNASGTLSKLGAGSAGSVLSTNGTGADPTWILMSAGGGGAGTVATPGSQYQLAGYYSGTGASVSGSSTFTNDTANGVVSITHSTASVGYSSGALLVFGGLGVSGQINTGSLISAGNLTINGNLDFKGVGTFGNATSDTINSLARYISDILPSTDNSRDLGNDSLGWRNFKVSGVGTIATLNISLSTSSTTTSTGALVVSGGVGIGGSLNAGAISKFFDHLEIKTEKEVRFYNSADTQYVAFKSGTISGNTTYTLPTAFPGSGSSFLTSDLSGVLTWASVTAGVSAVNAGVGISIPSSTGSVTVSIGRPVVLNMASGFTPVGIGTDYNILRVPEGKSNSNTIYSIRKVVMGVGTTSSGTSTIRVEKSIGPHTSTSGFNLSSTGSTWNALSADLSLLGGLGETSWITFTSGYGTAATGDRIRLNFTAVDSTHANFIVQVLLEEY